MSTDNKRPTDYPTMDGEGLDARAYVAHMRALHANAATSSTNKPSTNKPSGTTAKPKPPTTSSYVAMSAAMPMTPTATNERTLNVKTISYSRPHMAEPTREERCAAMIANADPALMSALAQADINIGDVVHALAQKDAPHTRHLGATAQRAQVHNPFVVCDPFAGGNRQR
jgi:hypothetical protein